MDKLIASISTPEGLFGVAITMAFVLILVKPVREALLGSNASDPTLSAINKLIAEIAKNNVEAVKQNVYFAENIQKFNRTIEGVGSIHTVLSNILTELVRSSKA